MARTKTEAQVLKCTRCGASNYNKEGLAWRKGKRIQRYRCHVCGSVFRESEGQQEWQQTGQ